MANCPICDREANDPADVAICIDHHLTEVRGQLSPNWECPLCGTSYPVGGGAAKLSRHATEHTEAEWALWRLGNM